MYKQIITLFFTVTLMVTTIPASAEKAPIRFAVPPWSGAMVKAEIATQILEAIGYTTATTPMDASEAYEALKNGDVDVFMSAWLPTQEMLLAPLLKNNSVHVAGANVEHARTGLCVPGYVSKKGVTSITDLAPSAAKFDSTIYNIEPTSGMYLVVDKYIHNDFEGLGSWKQKGTSIDNMLGNVIKAFKEKQWIVFSCWEPHWMNITLDMRYLKGVKGSEELIAENTINTLIRPELKTTYQTPYMILSRFKIDKLTQGKWTYDVSLKGQSVKETATSWIKGNLNVVRQWLGNLKVANGKRAVDIIETKF
ncbi:glycine betaine ABC transporter substrate-binding protein [Halodesulfovibrio aestuarii]|uniref:glycine betaine ABC transporter substrate-binding protein n=1 Tax=Halodesulfovibrio aestuarii TaxID=126333 RepID=UPI003521E9F7